jgi:hypothetical protein
VNLQLEPLALSEQIGLNLGETTEVDFAAGTTAAQRQERQRLYQVRIELHHYKANYYRRVSLLSISLSDAALPSLNFRRMHRSAPQFPSFLFLFFFFHRLCYLRAVDERTALS